MESRLRRKAPFGAEENTPRRFDVALLIIHPTIDPAEITAELGLESPHSWRVGEPRQTPKGNPLPGHYRDTRWRFSVQHEIKEQWFSEEIEKFVDSLAPHGTFLRGLRETGGKTCVIIQFFDDYYSDEISRATLSKIAALELDLGIECYSQPQGEKPVLK